MMAIVNTTILYDNSNKTHQRVEFMPDDVAYQERDRVRDKRSAADIEAAKKSNASLTINSDKLTLTINSADWFSWLATLPNSGASVIVQVADPDTGEIIRTIADIRWPTWWPRD